MENSQELIGILQAISIVAKSLAVKLMKIDREVRAYESAGEGVNQLYEQLEARIAALEAGAAGDVE